MSMTAEQKAQCCAAVEAGIQNTVVSSHGSLTEQILKHPDVDAAVQQAKAAGISIFSILAAILPFVLSIFTSGTIDWQGIIAAILALINPTPA